MWVPITPEVRCGMTFNLYVATDVSLLDYASSGARNCLNSFVVDYPSQSA